MRRLAEPFDALPAGVGRPAYDRSALATGIVHLGLGAFARAHLGAVHEAALHDSRDLRWGIVGVSLRQPDTRDALAPQQGLYTLALRDGDADGTMRETLRVIGCVREVLVAPENPGAVLERIAASDTRIVSLTVTEKGYCHDPASGALRPGHPDIAHDLAHAAAPRSVIGFIVHGLHRRLHAGAGPVTLLSCDNLPANGRTLRGLVLDFAARIDADLRDWIATRCTFPISMVDRIVPRTTDADRDRIAARLGAHDASPVVAEPFLDWVIEDDFAAGRPGWEAGGARFVADAGPYERLKLRMVNGSHSAIAYLGCIAGWHTVDAAMREPALHRFADALMRDEIASTLPALPGLDLDAYRARLLARFANPALQHRMRQIAMDGSQKLPQRLLDTVRDRLAANAPIDRLALVVAAWIRYLEGHDDAGDSYAIEDPLRDELAQQLAAAHRGADGSAANAATPDGPACGRLDDKSRRLDHEPGRIDDELRRVAAFCAYAPVFGELGRAPRFIAAVAKQSLALRHRGVRTTLEAFA